MPFRNYLVKQKYINKHGDVRVYPKIIKKWIKSKTPYKPQKRGSKREPIMTRFGPLDMYNRKKQQELICPSGYSISQCFNILKKLWYAYRRAIGTDNDIVKMKKYAKAIQNVQKDMGIQTSSFPDIELYGDVFVRNDKNGQRIVFERHSELKKEQEEYEKWEAENSLKIQRKLQRPNKEKGEAIVTFADDVFPYEKQACEATVPQQLKPNKEKGEKILTIVDNTPFRRAHRRRLHRKEVSIYTIADDVFPYEKQACEATVPQQLKPNKEKGEKILTIVDNTPFRRAHRRRRNRNGDSPLSIPDDEIPDEELEAEIEDTVPHIVEHEGDEEVLVLTDDIPFRS